jgi:hypothetical protein
LNNGGWEGRGWTEPSILTAGIHGETAFNIDIEIITKDRTIKLVQCMCMEGGTYGSGEGERRRFKVREYGWWPSSCLLNQIFRSFAKMENSAILFLLTILFWEIVIFHKICSLY